MGAIDEVKQLEAGLVQAELGPDPGWYETYLDDAVVLDGQQLKARVVAAHQPGSGAKFTAVEMRDYVYADHGDVVVLTCVGDYTGPKGTFGLKFMRVWQRKPAGWRIVAGSTGAA